MRPRPLLHLALLTAAVALALTLLAAELLLRAAGHPPWRRAELAAGDPGLFAPDPVRGWRNLPGEHVLPPRTGDARPLRQTHLPDGSRATGSETGQDGAAPLWALVGGSFAQGWGLSDEETLAWRLQARWPGVRLRNHATGGYGTYQSLLTMEELFAGPDPPKAVLYGFTQIHEERNVAAPRWLRSIGQSSREGMASLPYATLDDQNRLVRHPPLRYPEWPLREALATVTFVQDLTAERSGASRAAQARPVTERLLLEMQDLGLSRGARFVVLLLDFGSADRRHFGSFLRLHRIAFADCALPIPLARRIPRDGHPNGAHQRDWEACVAAALEPVP